MIQQANAGSLLGAFPNLHVGISSESSRLYDKWVLLLSLYLQ